MPNTVDVTDASFSNTVANSDKPVVVAFWAAWCGPCRLFAPILDEVAGEHADRIVVARLNVDENHGAVIDHQITGVPTTIVFQRGAPVLRLTGARSKRALLEELTPYFGAPD